MPTNHHAMIRYRTLDKCLSNPYRRYYIDDLVRECCDAIYNFCGIVDGVKKRQVWKDIAYMESPEGWDAPIEHLKDGKKVYLRYGVEGFSINKPPLSPEESAKLKETLFMLSRFRGLPQFAWVEEIISRLENNFALTGQERSVIGFDENLDYSGINYLTDLFNAIVNKQVLNIKYKKFTGEKREWTLHPYYIKQYNNRWFLYGLNDKLNIITNIALDRITSFSVAEGIDYKETDIDFNEYFGDVIGVTIKDEPVEKIVLKFSPHRFPYVLSKPIHMSMVVVDRQECIIHLHVIPNNELEQTIFSFGDDVEVLEPLWLREQIGKKIMKLAQVYQSKLEEEQ